MLNTQLFLPPRNKKKFPSLGNYVTIGYENKNYFKTDAVARYASLADHDTSTRKETSSFLRRIRSYRQSEV